MSQKDNKMCLKRKMMKNDRANEQCSMYLRKIFSKCKAKSIKGKLKGIPF